MSIYLFNVRKCRSSRPKMFCKKCVLKNFAKFTGKHLCHAEACNFIKKLYWLWHRVYFSVYFSVIFQNSLGTKFWIFAPKFAQKSEYYLNSYYKCDRYCKVCKVWQEVITKCDRYYKAWQLLQSKTWQVVYLNKLGALLQYLGSRFCIFCAFWTTFVRVPSFCLESLEWLF